MARGISATWSTTSSRVSKLIGGGIGADLDRIADARGPPGRGVEAARRGHAGSCQFDSQRRGFPVEVIEDTVGCGEMKQVPAGELGFHRDAAGCPPVGEAGGSAGVGHHRSGAHRDLEAIAHQRLVLEKVTSGSLTGRLTDRSSPFLFHPNGSHSHVPPGARWTCSS
jgi:hypothetical protein